MLIGLCVLILMLLLTACDSAAVPAPAPMPASSLPAPSTPTVSAYPVATATPRAIPPTPSPFAAGTIPPPPHNPTDWPQAVLAYLNANPQRVANLRSILAAWGVNGPATPLESVGDILLSADVDGDGQEDLLVALAPAEPNSCEIGALLFYQRQGNGYRIGQQVGLLAPTPIDPKISHVPCPKLFAARDLLHDGHTEIVDTSTACGAHTCFVMVDILRWTDNGLRSLMTQPLPSMAYPEIGFQESGRGATDLVLHGGIVGSVGAGPQRARREVYRWDGARFALAETIYDASNYLYFKIIDANALMLKKQYREAIALYQEAISNLKLELSELHPNERADLQAFARFRLSVAYALLGDASGAQTAKNSLLWQQGTHIYARVAQVFWDAYAPQKDVAAGCKAVTALAQVNAAIPAILSDFGYANPDFGAEDICPFGF